MFVEDSHDVVVGAADRCDERDRQDEEILCSYVHAASRIREGPC